MPTSGDDRPQLVGATAEALVCYDRVAIEINGPETFLRVVEFFDRTDDRMGLLNLLSGNELSFLYRTFTSAALSTGRFIHGINFITAHADVRGKEKPWNFVSKILDAPPVVRYLQEHPRDASELRALAAQAAIDEPLGDISSGYKNAEEDFFDRDRCTSMLHRQIEADRSLAEIPHIFEVRARCAQDITSQAQLVYDVEWRVPPSVEAALRERKLRLPEPAIVLAAQAADVELIQSAARIGSDMWIRPTRTSSVAEKLDEASKRALKLPAVVDDLIGQVGFPDLSALVLQEKLDARALFEIRARATKFRNWLQSEALQDRNAALMYMTEVVEDSGLNKVARKTLQLVGVIGGAVVGAAVAHQTAPLLGATVGGAAGGLASQGAKFLMNTAAKMDAGWKPAVFGKWLKGYVEPTGRNP